MVMKVDKNQKQFNLYVFFSTFARNLIELFIGTILYKNGFSVHEVIFYYLIVQLTCFIGTYPAVKFSKDYSNRILAFISIVAFIFTQFLLNTVVQNTLYLVIVGVSYGLFRICYWTSRRYYNLKVMKKEKIASSYSIISIVNQVSIIVSSYIGSLVLDFISVRTLTLISFLIFILSVFSLYFMRFEHEKNNERLDLLGALKKIPKSNLYLFASYELLALLKFFVPLYIFIYVSNNYQTIGILTLISNVATIIITYIYGKCIDNDKNYYKSCILFLVLIFIAKVNVNSKLLFIVSFFDGVAQKLLELSIQKEFYLQSKKFEYYNFNLVYEFLLNLFRVIVVGVIYFFVFDIKNMVYITLIFIAAGILFNFKELNLSEYSVKKRK